MAIYHVKFIGDGSRSVYSTGIKENAIKEANRLHKATDKHLEVVKLEQIYKTYGIEEKTA